MYSETRFAVAHLGHSSHGTRSQLNFKKSEDGAPKARNHGTAEQPDSASKLNNCHVCGRPHLERWHDCPLLKEVRIKKVPLPQNCCHLCLGRKNPDGKCRKGDDCWLYTTQKGDHYNLLCKLHNKTHFKICTLCPAKTTRFNEQQISNLRFRVTPAGDLPHPLKNLESEASDVLLKLQRLTSDEILLDNTTPLSEVVDVWNPHTHSYTPSLVQYDCGGGLCLIQDGSHLNLKTQPDLAVSAQIRCMNATTKRQFQVVTVRMRSLTQNATLELCVSQFPWEAPKEELARIKFPNCPPVVIPSAAEMKDMPKILLGIRTALLLPEPVAQELIPATFRKDWPGLAVFKSKLTGNLLFAGMLGRQENY